MTIPPTALPGETGQVGATPNGRPLFALWQTATIAALLVVPFCIYKVAGIEPYPAVIMPGGGWIETRIIEDQASFGISSFFGFDHNGRSVELDRTALLDPIPPSHSGGLARTLFGQDTTPRIDLRIRPGRMNLWIRGIPRPVPSEQQRLDARTWLAGKLAADGLRTNALSIRDERLLVDYATGNVISREVIRERLISLD